jgi:hypothetical protein
MEAVYIVQTRESIRMNENVYKIGRTAQLYTKRFTSYPKNSDLKIQMSVTNSKDVEYKIKEKFKQKFNQRKDMGIEYFEGPYHDLLAEFMHIVNSCDTKNNITLDFGKENLKLPMYECDKCGYLSNTKCNLEKHKQRINPCRRSRYGNDNVCEMNDGGEHNVTHEKQNVTQNDSKFKCNYCKKTPSVNPKTYKCERCLSSFTTRQGRHKHNKNVKCKVFVSSSSTNNGVSSIICNNTQNHTIIKPDEYGDGVYIRGDDKEWEFREFEDIRDELVNTLSKYIKMYTKKKNVLGVRLIDKRERRLIEEVGYLIMTLDGDLPEALFEELDIDDEVNEEDVKNITRKFDKSTMKKLHSKTSFHYKKENGDYVIKS